MMQNMMAPQIGTPGTVTLQPGQMPMQGENFRYASPGGLSTRPDIQGFLSNLAAWRHELPAFGNFRLGGQNMFAPQGPGAPPGIMTPGGGGTGAPLQGQAAPSGVMPMVGTPIGTSMGVIGATPATSPFGLPGY